MKKIRFISYIILLFLINTFVANNQKLKKIKLYIFYTPSHIIFRDQWFLPSLKDNFEIIEEFHEQDCPSGQFNTHGWITTMLKKVNLIIRAIKENWGNVFIYADVDIQFFASIQDQITQLMREKDMVIQKDSPKGQLCAGFFACRGNKKTLKLWTDIKNRMIKEHKRDQRLLNWCLRQKNDYYAINWDYLPETFFSAGVIDGKRWEPGQPLSIPKNIVLHHATWTKGIKNKIEQLIYVRRMVF